MPEERICPLCGRANPLAMPRCINCGQRISSGSVLLAEKTEAETGITGTAGHEPWWQSSEARPGGMPLPPQVREQSQREEIARAEAARREVKRRLEEEEKQRQAAAIEAEVKRRLEAAQKRNSEDFKILWKKTPVCTQCGADLQREGQGLSFCHECGADSPAGTVLVPPPVQGSFTPPRQPRPQVNAAAPSASSVAATGSAKQAAQQQQQVSVSQTSAARTASPTGAAMFSFFLPGVGQFLNKQSVKGALLLLSLFFIGPILDFGTFGLAGLILRIVAAIDAYRIAERRRQGKPVRDGEWDLG